MPLFLHYLFGSYCLADGAEQSVHVFMDTEYASQLARARTMLAALNAMIEHHARDAEQRDDGHFAAELEALCTKLGEAAICITPVEFPR